MESADNLATVDFVHSLLNVGRVVLWNDQLPSPVEIEAAAAAVCEFEETYRQTLPAVPPAVQRECIRWSVQMFYRASQLLAYRYLGTTEIAESLAAECPGAASPERTYSVDLLFRFLPDLIRLCRATSPDDPLLEQLLNWARAWPLSSVGVKDAAVGDVVPGDAAVGDAAVGNVAVGNAAVGDVPEILNHLCLRVLYVDRVMMALDASRLSEPGVRAAVRAAVGAYPELLPAWAATISSDQQESN